MIKLQIVLDLEAPNHGEMSRLLVDLNDVLKQNDYVRSELNISLLPGQRPQAENEQSTDERKDFFDSSGGGIPGTVGGESVDIDQGYRSHDPEGSGGDTDNRQTGSDQEGGTKGLQKKISQSNREQ